MPSPNSTLGWPNQLPQSQIFPGSVLHSEILTLRMFGKFRVCWHNSARFSFLGFRRFGCTLALLEVSPFSRQDLIPVPPRRTNASSPSPCMDVGGWSNSYLHILHLAANPPGPAEHAARSRTPRRGVSREPG